MNLQRIKKKIIKDLRVEIPELSVEGANILLKRLTSKKNIVFELDFKRKPKKLPKVVILKLFRKENADNEYKTYKKLENQKLSIPKLLLFKKPYLILEKVEGINLCDLINDHLINKIKLDELKPSVFEIVTNSVHKVAEWMANLHSQNIVEKRGSSEIIVLNKGDSRLRDFIMNIDKNILYGFDFEDSYEGNFHDDLAWICCALLDTNPGIFEIFEPKHKTKLINIFLEKYFRINVNFQFSFEYFVDQLIENLNIVIKRRSLTIGPINKESIFKNISGDY